HSNGGNVYGFVNVALAHVFVNGIVGDEAYLTEFIRLGIEILVVVGNLRQKRIARLGAVFMGRSGFGEGRVVEGTVGPGERNRLGQRNLCRLSGRRSLLGGVYGLGRLRLR